MPRGQKSEGETPLSNAERQARYRARHLKQPPPIVIRTRRPVDRRSRPQRWDDATNVLLGIQVECADWLMALRTACVAPPWRRRLKRSPIST